MIVVGRLIKRETADGLAGLDDATPSGKHYLFDTRSIRTVTLQHLPTGTIHDKEVINPIHIDGNEIVYDPFLYTELLEFIDLRGRG